MTYDRNRYRVTKLLVCLNIGNIVDNKVLRKTLKSCTFARGQLTRIFIDIRLVNQDFAAIFIIAGTNCVRIWALLVKQAITEAIPFFFVFNTPSLMSGPEAI